MDKNTMRQEVQQKLSLLDDHLYDTYSEDIHDKLFHLQAWKEAKVIGITISKGKEVDTKKIIERAWEEKKTVVVPKCEPSSKEMHFREIHSYSNLEVIYFGLYEPKICETKEISKEKINLMIVPGIVFNRHGYRIGYGGGFYDRYLQMFNSPTIALAFSIQIYKEVPFEKHDIPVDTIIIENEVIDCRE